MPFVRPSRSDQRLWFEAGEAMRLHKAANMFAQRPGAYPSGPPGGRRFRHGQSGGGGEAGDGLGAPPPAHLLQRAPARVPQSLVLNPPGLTLVGVLMRQRDGWVLLSPKGAAPLSPHRPCGGRPWCGPRSGL